MNQKLLFLTSKFFKVDIDTINEETTADDVEGWDSLGHATYLIFLEKEFGIEFDLNDMLDIDNLGSLSKKIDKLLE